MSLKDKLPYLLTDEDETLDADRDDDPFADDVTDELNFNIDPERHYDLSTLIDDHWLEEIDSLEQYQEDWNDDDYGPAFDDDPEIDNERW